MSSLTTKTKLLFVINQGSGDNIIDYAAEIDAFFKNNKEITIIKFLLSKNTDCLILRDEIAGIKPDQVVAVGGDGTIKLLAEVLLGLDIPLGILPAGSANGMAKELNIPTEPELALKLLTEGSPHRIHLVKVNEELCIHLSDIGFNAYVVKTFDAQPGRGMFGYVKAAWKVLWRHAKMNAIFTINGQTVQREAVMIVIANATTYGTGVKINPNGKLDDDLFEVIIVKKISIIEMLKMRFSHFPFNPDKTEVLQTRSLIIHSRKKVHFQVDGEYIGKVNHIRAEIFPDAISIIY